MFWGRAGSPAGCLGGGIGFVIDPSFRTFGAFSEIEQIALRKAVCGFPLVVIVFVCAGDIDGIKPVVIPDRGRDASDFDFMGWLRHVFGFLCLIQNACGRQRKGARCDTSRPLLKPSGPKIPHGAANPTRAKLVYSEVWRRRRVSAHSRRSRRR